MEAVRIVPVLAFLQTCSTLYQSNGLTHCHTSTNLSVLEVLPGGGWDNLRNMDMGRVMNLRYSKCQTTKDGQYLIPDEVFVIPQKETDMETRSEIISSWSEHKSSTSSSINMEETFLWWLNGKFSTENQKMKTHQVNYSAKTARVQVRDWVYSVKAYPDFTLDSRFVQQIKDIADAIENNQTKNAAYLSEKMVVDYGTHVITSLDAGASLVKEDYLRSKYVSDNTQKDFDIIVQARLNFNLFKFEKDTLDIGVGSSQQSSSLQTYQDNIQYSMTQSHGGVPFYPGITLQKWQESTRNNLVAIDRSGVPLHYIINHNSLEDLPRPTVEKVSQSVKQAIQRYYQVNTRPGCVDVNSKNFNFQTNVDDSSCEGPATNLNFGGVYQRCDQISSDAGPLCEKLAQKNPDTGDFSCRSPYTPTLLRSEVRQEGYTLNKCHTEHESCYLFLQCDKEVCSNDLNVRSARINTYWCSVNGSAPENSGYLFGGLYSPSVSNPITKSKSCPKEFIPVKFLSDGMMMCLSQDYETGSRYAKQFGGLFSCQSNNPLANEQRRCPHEFSQHSATVSDGCEVLYCVQSRSFTWEDLNPVHLPPFTTPPVIRVEANNTVMVMTEGEKQWVKKADNTKWKLATPEGIQDAEKKMDTVNDQKSSGGKTAVAFRAMALVALVTVAL